MTCVEERFVNHNMNYGQSHRVSEYRDRFIILAQELDKLPESREKATALTKLEECSFFTTACIARNRGDL